MKKYVLLIVFFVSIFFNGYVLSQDSTFSKIYSFVPYKTSIFNSLVVTDSCYYVTGIVADSVYPYRTGALFAKIDLNGNVEVMKGLTDTIERYETWFQSLSIDENGHLFTHGYNYNRDTSTIFLIEYNTDGSLIDLSYFHVLANSIQELPHDMIKTKNGFAIAIVVDNLLTPFKITQYLLIIDKAGQVLINKKGHDYVNRNLLSRIANCPDKGYIIGGLGDNRDVTNDNITNQIVLLKFDSIGNQVWDYHSPIEEDWMGVLGGIIVNDNNEIVFGTAKGIPYMINSSTEEYLWDWCIIKMNMEKNILWRTFFRPDSFSHSLTARHLWNIIPLRKSNGYVAVGQDFISGPEWFGWLVKVGENGDSLWMRKYKMEGKNIVHRLKDIKEDQQGNLIMVGEYQDLLDSIGSQKGWLLKLDKYGCLVPGCHKVGVKDIEKKEHKIKILVYPNPTKDFINFYTVFPNEISHLYYRIIDVSGNVIIAKSHLESDVTYLHNTSSFNSTIYYLQILKSNSIITSNKFLITK